MFKVGGRIRVQQVPPGVSFIEVGAIGTILRPDDYSLDYYWATFACILGGSIDYTGMEGRDYVAYSPIDIFGYIRGNLLKAG